jgi:PmbA protein
MSIADSMQQMADLARATHCEQFDILGYESHSEGVEVFEQKVSSTEIQKSAALGVRVFVGGRPGLAFTERLSSEALKLCLADAVSHTQLTDAVAFDLPEPRPAATQNFDRISADYDTVTFPELTRFAMELEAQTRGSDSRIENVPYTGAGRSSSTSYLLNSKGVEYRRTTQEVSAYTAAVAALGDQKKMGFYSNSRLNFKELAALPTSKLAVERTLEQLGAVPVAHGNYSVLFTNRVSGQILSMYASPYFGDMAQRGQSRLKGKLGTKIASDQLSIFSDAHAAGLKGSSALDSEGYPTQLMKVVENGYFNHFLYNLEAAALDKVAPTGNSSRSVGSKASTAFKNLIVPPGMETAQKLASQGTVLVIDKLEGSAGCSPVSGEFSIGAQGYLVENGVLKHPVDRITLSTNYFDMIQNIVAFSNSYNDQYSSVRVPDMLITNIAVAG